MFTLKRKSSFPITKKKGNKSQPLQAERTFTWVARKAFHFPPQTCLSLNHSYLLALLNLVKWNTDEGINSHVVYGEAPIKPQYSWIKWVLMHWGDQKSFACYHSSATQPNLIPMPHAFFQCIVILTQYRDLSGTEYTIESI